MEEKKPAFIHEDVEKISADIMKFENGVIRINVMTSKYDTDGKRSSYHKEFEYIKRGKAVLVIRQSYNYFLTFENIKGDADGHKGYVQLKIKDIPFLITALNHLCRRFEHHMYEFYKSTDDGNFNIKEKFREKVPFFNLIEFENILINDGENSRVPGIRIHLKNDDNCYFDSSVQDIYGLKYILETTSIFEMAQNLINSIDQPELGTNLISFVSGTNKFDNALGEEHVEGRAGRKIQTKAKDFFAQFKEVSDDE